MGILSMLGSSSGNLNIRINTGKMKSYAEQLEEINKDIASLEDELMENISSLESEISSAKAQNSSNDEDDSDIDTSAWEDELYKCNVFKNILCSSMYNMVLSRCTKGMIKTAEEFENVELQLSQFDFKTSAQIFTAGTANSQNNKESIPIANKNDGSIISTSNMNEAELYEYFVKNVFKSDGAIVNEHKKALEFDLWLKDNYGKTKKEAGNWKNIESISFIVVEMLDEKQKDQLKNGERVKFNKEQMEIIISLLRKPGMLLENEYDLPIFNTDGTLITRQDSKNEELFKYFIKNVLVEDNLTDDPASIVTKEQMIEIRYNNWIKEKYGKNSYLEDSYLSFIKGPYHKNTTGLAITTDIGTGLLGVDAPIDIRNLNHNVTNWENTLPHYFETASNAVSLLPGVGAVIKGVKGLKYADEIATLTKNADNVSDALKQMNKMSNIKYVDKLSNSKTIVKTANGIFEIKDSTGKTIKNLDNIDDVLNELGVSVKNIDDVVKGGSKLEIKEILPPGAKNPVKVYTDGNAQVNAGKVDTYIRGKVKLDLEVNQIRRGELEAIKKNTPELFDNNMKKELKLLDDQLHNYQRSQEMSKTLNNAGIMDTPENNEMITEILFEAAKNVKPDNTKIISSLSGPDGDILVESWWVISEDGTPYMTTIILKPIK